MGRDQHIRSRTRPYEKDRRRRAATIPQRVWGRRMRCARTTDKFDQASPRCESASAKPGSSDMKVCDRVLKRTAGLSQQSRGGLESSHAHGQAKTRVTFARQTTSFRDSYRGGRNPCYYMRAPDKAHRPGHVVPIRFTPRPTSEKNLAPRLLPCARKLTPPPGMCRSSLPDLRPR